MIKLYNEPLSGNCYKLRLLMALLDLPYERIPVNFHPGREHKRPAFLALNPFGQLPVIDDDGFVLRDAQAILVYLATRHDPEARWFPAEARQRAQVVLWLTVAEDITRTASAARLHDGFGYDFDAPACRAAAHKLFAHVDATLADAEAEGRQWLVGDRATLADIACFPYIALAPEGGVDLARYPALRRWIGRIKRLPGFVGMPGIFEVGVDAQPA